MNSEADNEDQRFGDDPSRDEADRSGAEPGFAQLMNSFSLDSDRPRRRRGRGRAREPEPEAPEQQRAEPNEHTEPSQPTRPPSPRQRPGELSSPDVFGQRGFEGELEDPATLVRPYTWTGGRTKSNLRLELETLVSSNREVVAAHPGLPREHRLIAALCRHPHSVAEVAAKLAVPLGVARVLLSDMAEQDLVNVHSAPDLNDRAAHYNVMERVLSGLRRL